MERTLLELDGRALASTAHFVDRLRLEQLGDPTPCDAWDVRALLNHVVGGCHLFGAAALEARGDRSGSPAGDWATRDDDRVGDDPRGAYAAGADLVTRAFADLDLELHQLTLPFGRLPAAQAVAIHFVDVLVHGWDLAVATGQDPTLDPDLVRPALEIVATYPEAAWGNPQFFAEKVTLDEAAAPHERLVALLGRARKPI